MKRVNGAKIRQLRVEKGWSQELLGEYVNINQRTISDIELNRNKSDIGEKDINVFAEVFQVSPEYFFDDESNIEAHEFIELYGDFEVKNIKVELECTKTSIYRNNELIDEDSETSTVVVLEV